MDTRASYVCSNNVPIPALGFGTWQLSPGNETIRAVSIALEAGYRHIDTAACYENEREVGEAVRTSGIPRAEIFITSKVWNSHRGYENARRAFEASMARLGLDYLDLYLIHWPATARTGSGWQALNSETWRALESVYAEKRVRAIGVSNFLTHHLEPLLANASIKPMVNQLEYHPGLLQKDTKALCRASGIVFEAWAPLGKGKALTHPDIRAIAERLGKTSAQVIIRWCIQNEALPLPKSAHTERIHENYAVFDFELSQADIDAISGLPPFCDSGLHPDRVTF
ncbi:MAG: aldo/keto reductase [Spirochaetota bacterium]|nr:aldo/keto reductase [Spirochaetota bacterium]